MSALGITANIQKLNQLKPNTEDCKRSANE